MKNLETVDFQKSAYLSNIKPGQLLLFHPICSVSDLVGGLFDLVMSRDKIIDIFGAQGLLTVNSPFSFLPYLAIGNCCHVWFFRKHA